MPDVGFPMLFPPGVPGLGVGAKQLYTLLNAAADPAHLETNATTNWTAAACTLTSDSSVKYAGGYSLKGVFTGNGGNTRVDLSLCGLIVGQRYRMTLAYRHLGSGGAVRIGLAAGPLPAVILFATLTSVDTTFVTHSEDFTHSANTAFLTAYENSATNDGGIYIDNISIIQLP